MNNRGRGVKPLHSRKRVKKAGDNIRDDKATDEDYKVLDNWRASHAHVLNTFQANLRGRTRKTNFLVGERLKRRVTIIDKLRNRQRDMNLARMNDIAGCRIILPDTESLLKFREQIVSIGRAKHVRITEDQDQYNYIERPKESGYRGIHDVYKYRANSKNAQDWDNLRIEIQYRTSIQHAWSTAVETADLLTKSRVKFSDADSDYENFFRAASEILSRCFEQSRACLPDFTDGEIVDLYEASNDATNLFDILRTTNALSPDLSEKFFKKRLNTILIFPHGEAGPSLRVHTYRTSSEATLKYGELEADLGDTADVVLVRAEDASTLRKVFQNYFVDTHDFIRLLRNGLKIMRKA